MSENRRQVAEIVAALAIRDLPDLRWFGEPVVRFPVRVRRKLAAGTAQKLAIQVLERLLYSQFYVWGGAQPFRRTPYIVDTGIDEQAFRSALVAANRGAHYLETGWKAVGEAGARLVIERDDLRVSADRERLLDVHGRIAADAEVGATVAVSRPAILPRLSPGYVMLVGNRPLSGGDMLRFYWNIVPRAAPLLMRVVPRALNAEGIPFNLKALDSPRLYARTDAAVLYLRQKDAQDAAGILRRCHRRLVRFMDPDIPALTWRIAEGLGAAEDPGTGASFGMSRCRLIAEGLVEAHASGAKTDAARIEAVAERFEAEGLSLERAHLRAGSQGQWSELHASRAGSPRRRRHVASTDAGSLAEAMFSGMADRAIWHNGQCTWVGCPNEQVRTASDRRVVPLDGSLYGGTSGVALALAEMAAASGARRMRTTALGALRHAVRDVSRADSKLSRLGSYVGAVGVAWAAACAARLLDSDEADAAAAAVLRRIPASPRRDGEVDLLVGAAGGAMALGSLCRLGHRDRARPLLEACVSRVLPAARPQPHGVAWLTPSEPGRAPLTGFSHGAAGIAASLAIAYAELGDQRCLEAAFAAVEYEQSVFDACRKNWPDLRFSRGRATSEYSTFWCHGAPGIALSRLILADVTGRSDFLDQASIALGTTADAVSAHTKSPSAAHCLCHGLPGNILVLHAALARDGAPRKDAWPGILADALESLVADYAPRGASPVRSPADAGTSGLFLGEAGLAYAFLALAGGARSRGLELHE